MKSSEQNLLDALAAWEAVVGRDAVRRDSSDGEFGSRATFATGRSAAAVVSPHSREEVQGCLRVANTFGVPLYPVSAGKNWGFGSAVPTQSGCVVLDLRQMNRVVDFSEDLAYVSVEPGVTFRQLAGHLSELHSGLMLSVPGTTPEASVLANVLERGHGSGVYADRLQHVCGLEVVLPTGDLIHTGYGRFPGARAAKVARWGVGPVFDGLFTQSNLGVVTGMTVWLSPKPACLEVCEFGVRTGEALGAAIDVLRRLRLAGVVRSPVTVLNDFKLLSLYQRYPWELAGFRTPLSAAVRRQVTASRMILPWTGWVSLPAAAARQARADRELVESMLRPVVDTWVVLDNDGVLDPAGAITHIGAPRSGGQFGVPTEVSVRGIYWRKRSDPPAAGVDLDRDGCGKLTASVAVPLESGHVRAAVGVMEDVISGCGFEPFISVVGVAERHTEVIGFVVYDRHVEGEDDRALSCHGSLLDRLQADGFIPDRVGIQAMGSLPAPADDYVRFSRAIKRAVDPSGILAPGRYDCPERPTEGDDNSSTQKPATP